MTADALVSRKTHIPHLLFEIALIAAHFYVVGW